MSKKKGVKPKKWTKKMYEKFEDCVLKVKEQNKKGKKKYNPWAVCHASLKYDLPDPFDVHFETADVILRLVPEIDNLFEIGIYVDPDTFRKLKEKMDEMGIHYDKIEEGYIARRGRKEKATNVFIIES